MRAAVEVAGLRVAFGGRPVLNEVSVRFEPGRFTAVCGPNGAGKTTLLRAAAGLLRASAGRVEVLGRPVGELTPMERAGALAYLPQQRGIGWGVSALTVAALGAATALPAVAEARARAALRSVGMGGFEDRSVFAMSGGEAARVLLARVFASDAPILLLDEPVAGLDPDSRLAVMERLSAEAREGACVVATLHDLALAARYCDTLVVLNEGRVASEGPPRDALSRETLERVFNVSGRWAAGGGLVLSSRRSGPGSPRNSRA
jgi:iron complex transport system ATP-binding protein